MASEQPNRTVVTGAEFRADQMNSDMDTCVHRSPAEYVPAINTSRFLRDTSHVLVVGVSGGRDYFTLRSEGKHVEALDIAPQEGIPDLVIQSVENGTPFVDSAFDGVVLNEVIEHLFLDLGALQEMHRVLRDDGVLVLTVPYYNGSQDIPEYHVRIHTERTIRRLLERAGFAVEEHFVRGIVSRFPNMNRACWYLLRLTHLLAWRFWTRDEPTAIRLVNGVLERIERYLGSHRHTVWIQRKSKSYGGIIKARKLAAGKDYDSVQIRHFAHTPQSPAPRNVVDPN